MKKTSAVPILVLLAFAVLAPVSPADALERIYLVRHAEKEEPWTEAHGEAQPLSEAGHERSHRLIERLANAGVAAVYASATTRARDTGKPFAAATGVPLETDADSISSDLRVLARFRARLEERHADDRAILVVAHSNTIPYLLVAFGAGDECRDRLGVNDENLIEGYDGLWQIDLDRPGCAGMVRLSQDGNGF